ncbi:hypothetical protein FN846DRAFT_69815 [Sphaerosporella brunnea]|uniref:C2H2-type domain-containing protein n=1 Tax=Sphaerosporella brunnea TaxID=1250544 RepID=A0A5J5ETV6_9PEZI|nr:hypothetical protein FN846DRAFT_69815 [Sphaerosporella brunnea]
MDILELIDDKDQQIAESSQRPFQCPEIDCIKSFNRKSDLQRHHRIHTNERPYTCHYRECGKSFIQRSALTVHIRTHTGEKPHKCEYLGCGKCFSDSSSLARHRRIHTGKRPYRCPIDGCEKSFCRKTTLTKHARRQHHVLENDGAESEIGDEETEDEPTSMPKKTMSKTHQKKLVVRRMQQAQRKNNALMHSNLLRANGAYHEPLSPHSPMTLPSSTSSSRHTSFSASSAWNSDAQMMMNGPPTPQSPYFEHDHRSVSPMIHTPVSQGFDNGLRIVLDTRTQDQLLADAQRLQSSPGSLSSCSTVSTQSSVDYFCRAAQPSTPFQSPYPMSPAYPTPSPMHQTPQFHPSVQFHQTPFSAIGQAPQVWYEMQPHQHHLLSAQQNFGYADIPMIKQEPESGLLQSPGRSYC